MFKFIKTLMAESAARKEIAALKQRHAEALRQLRAGDPLPMRGIAEALDLGDAWHELAQFEAAKLGGAADEIEATTLFERAMRSTRWLSNSAWAAREEHDRRLFLGIGCEPNHASLQRDWSGLHHPGYGREVELAWISTFAPGQKHDPRAAWRWLALGEARWGRRGQDRPLPTGSVDELRAQLEQALPTEVRESIVEEAKDAAYAEFVAGK